MDLAPRWLTFNEAREYGSFSEKRLRALIAAGDIRAARPNGTGDYRVDRLSIDEYYTRHMVGGADPEVLATVAKLAARV